MPHEIKKIDAGVVADWIIRKVDFQLVDVSGSDRTPAINKEILFIDFTEIQQHVNQLRTDIPVVLACRFGEISYFAAFKLREIFKSSELYSLSGGFIALEKSLELYQQH
jgi:rhodanese-related sulfurtransferase